MAWHSESKIPTVGAQAAALVAASFLSGAMMGLSAIAVPVFLDTNTEPAALLGQWARLYHYGHTYMPALSVATTGLYGYVALAKRAAKIGQWLVYAAAGVLTISMVFFTWAMMVPTNNTLFRLLEMQTAASLASVQSLVVKWAWLHVVRSLFPLAGAILGLVGMLRELGL